MRIWPKTEDFQFGKSKIVGGGKSQTTNFLLLKKFTAMAQNALLDGEAKLQ